MKTQDLVLTFSKINIAIEGNANELARRAAEHDKPEVLLLVDALRMLYMQLDNITHEIKEVGEE